MNGVMIPCVSAGSNQVGASETWMRPGQLAARARRRGRCRERRRQGRERVSGENVPTRQAGLVRAADWYAAAADSELHQTSSASSASSSEPCAECRRTPCGNVSHFLAASDRRAAASGRRGSSAAFDRDVLVGRGVGKAGIRPNPDSPTRGPTPLMNASCQIGATDRFARAPAAASCRRIAARFLWSSSAACCWNSASISG